MCAIYPPIFLHTNAKMGVNYPNQDFEYHITFALMSHNKWANLLVKIGNELKSFILLLVFHQSLRMFFFFFFLKMKNIYMRNYN